MTYKVFVELLHLLLFYHFNHSVFYYSNNFNVCVCPNTCVNVL